MSVPSSASRTSIDSQRRRNQTRRQSTSAYSSVDFYQAHVIHDDTTATDRARILRSPPVVRLWTKFYKGISGLNRSQYFFLLLLGILTALISLGIDVCINYVLSLRKYWTRELPFPFGLMVYLLESVFFACLACCVVKYMSPLAAGSGIPEMKSILSGVYMPKFLDFKTLVAKILGLLAVFMAGIPIGKEGPMVHIASCLSEQLMMRIPMFSKIYRADFIRYQMLSVGCAIGIATTFGSPFGGVLFALETTATYFMVSNLWKGLLCTVTGAATFYIMRSVSSYDQMLYLLPAYIPPKPYATQELILFGLLGVIAGVFGAAIIATMRQFLRWRRSWVPLKENIFGVTVAATIAGVLLTYPFVFMRGTTQPEFIAQMLAEKLPKDYDSPNPILNLLMLLGVQFFLITLSVSLPIPLGVSRPASLLGAIVGRIFGELAKMYLSGYSPNITPSTYAVVAATACVASTARTLSTAMVVFESTGHMEMLLPVCVAVIIAYMVGNSLILSCYDTVIDLRKLPLMMEPQPAKKFSRGVATDVMIRHPRIFFLTLNSTVRDIDNLLQTSMHFSYPVVASTTDMTLVGTVQRFHLENMIEDYVRLNLHASTRKERIQFVETRLDIYVLDHLSDGLSPLQDVRTSSNEVVHDSSVDLMVTDAHVANRDGKRKSGHDGVKESESLIDMNDGNEHEYGDSTMVDDHSTSTVGKHADADDRVSEDHLADAGPKVIDVETGNTMVEMRDMGSVEEQVAYKHRVLQYLAETQYLAKERSNQIRCAVPVDLSPFIMTERAPLYKMHFAFAMMGVSHALIVSAGKLVGVVTKKDLLDYMRTHAKS